MQKLIQIIMLILLTLLTSVLCFSETKNKFVFTYENLNNDTVIDTLMISLDTIYPFKLKEVSIHWGVIDSNNCCLDSTFFYTDIN